MKCRKNTPPKINEQKKKSNFVRSMGMDRLLWLFQFANYTENTISYTKHTFCIRKMALRFRWRHKLKRRAIDNWKQANDQNWSHFFCIGILNRTISSIYLCCPDIEIKLPTEFVRRSSLQPAWNVQNLLSQLCCRFQKRYFYFSDRREQCHVNVNSSLPVWKKKTEKKI